MNMIRSAVMLAMMLVSGLPGAQSANAAAVSGDEVLVVFNTALPASKDIAEHYAKTRSVPNTQVLGLPVSTSTDVTRAEFRDTLQIPLARLIEQKGLWKFGEAQRPDRKEGRTRKVVSSRIRYIVLCYGVPYRIQADPSLKEEGTESWREEMRRNEASVDTELALLPMHEQKIVLAGPLRNVLFGTTNRHSLHPTNGVIMVTRLDGPGPDVARALVDKAVEAEKTGLYGRAYFDIRNIADPKYVSGDQALGKAAEICRRLGYETIIETNGGTFPASFPMSHIAFYAGWYDETVSGPFTRPVVEFMPGAFAYHLHSFSGASVRSTNQNWVGPLLAKGVTVTMGTVAEPYLGGTPDMPTFTARFLFDGWTFGEAAYAAQGVLSWQLTIVGDPLYRALPRNPDLLHNALVNSQHPMQEWSWLKLINANVANGRSIAEVVLLLEDGQFRKSSAILTERLADMYAALGKPSSSAHAAEQALSLAKSPGQRLRLRLFLADKYNSSGELKRASEHLSRLLEEAPDYQGKAEVYQRLAALARQQNDDAAAQGFEQKSQDR